MILFFALGPDGFVFRDQFIHRPVQGLIYFLARWIGVIPGHDFVRPAGKGDRGAEVRNQTLDLGIVEDHAVRLVSEQAGDFRLRAWADIAEQGSQERRDGGRTPSRPSRRRSGGNRGSDRKLS